MADLLPVIVGLTLLASCGGQSERREAAEGASAASSGGQAAAGGFTATGGATQGGADGQTGGVASTGGVLATGGVTGMGGGTTLGGSSNGGYVPDHPNQPVSGDGRLKGGSFEENLGFGWDFCFSKYPGASHSMSTPRDGQRYLTFDSSLSCESSSGCAQTGGEAQVGFWFDSAVPARDSVSLYWDIANLGTGQPDGALVIHALASACDSAEVLATIPLAALAVDATWQTRCVSFAANAPLDALGFHVTGGSFRIGLDVFRFGPPCHD